jgi:hypothetical protein
MFHDILQNLKDSFVQASFFRCATRESVSRRIVIDVSRRKMIGQDVKNIIMDDGIVV